MRRIIAGVMLVLLMLVGGQVGCPDQAEHSYGQELTLSKAISADKHAVPHIGQSEHCLSVQLNCDHPEISMVRVEYRAHFSEAITSITGTPVAPGHRPPILTA
ncbi:hypothetical protein [Rhizobium sp. BG4]|uniref:hypothetical protein n=1 Tax=Rhizobium sp. BG4 TaxID=2613770 RepID=UPI00193DB777|nr:hypothetical protein [Rhizobium sp. BG4]QRM45139.1 hypothetical protein F2982_17880 [Rhizobium sp. BG4]